MKTSFLKNAFPFAVAVLGITGAFVTTSMQRAEKMAANETGWTLKPGPGNQCDDIPVNCGDYSDQVCRVNGETGDQAFGKDELNRCVRILYQPEP